MPVDLSRVAATPDHPEYLRLTARHDRLYRRDEDPRPPFNRDYNRILHCTAYRRLKNKTQVFYATENDHVCTRIEHVNHVVAIANTIAAGFRLNAELTNAIAIGHDVGHAPFGHEGGEILSLLMKERMGRHFWHERNSLWFVDNIETLTDPDNRQMNLGLTYAVRDGIIAHCGEVDQTGLRPRTDFIRLEDEFAAPAQHHPVTWEGCVIKIADKIAYLGRDIEDAFTLGLYTREEFSGKIADIDPSFPADFRRVFGIDLVNISNSYLIHRFILDVFAASTLESGLSFSAEYHALMKKLRSFSNRLIYQHPRLKHFVDFARLIIESIFKELEKYWSADPAIFLSGLARLERFAPRLHREFFDWTVKYSSLDLEEKERRGYWNRVVYDYSSQDDYLLAVLDFISGMTDRFAISVHRELTSFR